MIRKTSEGYVVLSESGKILSRKDLTLSEAKKRLRQIEMFRHMKKDK